MDHPLQHHHYRHYQQQQQQQQGLYRSSSMPLPEVSCRPRTQHHLNPQQQQQELLHHHPTAQTHHQYHHPESQDQMYQQQQQHLQQQQHYQQQHYQQQHVPQDNSGSNYSINRQSNYHSLVASTSSSSSPTSFSSRAKCDQVIYEAIAKVCEIAVRGRCTTADVVVPAIEEEEEEGKVDHRHYTSSIDSSARSAAIGGGYVPDNNYHRRAVTMIDSSSRRNNTSYSYGRSRSGDIGAIGSSGGSSSKSNRGRFNIEVDEVHSIRNSQALASWKELHSTSSTLHCNQQQQQQPKQQTQHHQSQSSRETVHVPLRLDIYYEHDNFSCNYAEPTLQPSPQRELLERWCIDYHILSPSITSPFSSTTSSSHYQHHHNNRSSSSPYTSPSSSPHSSIVMTGARPDKSTATSTNASAATTTTSQLRRVCRRIVVLLRSLHCMTRILPAYQLRCLLLSNTARHDYDGGRGVGATKVGGGWGTVGYSLHIAPSFSDGPEPLPSPSFAVRTFPMVPTPYGHLSLSVMYDASLVPQRMIADVAERRGEWMMMRQQQTIWEQQQQLEPHPVMTPMYSPTMPASPHIPISHQPQDDDRLHQHNQQRQVQQQQQHSLMSSGGGREHMSCPPTIAWITSMNGGGSQNIASSSLGGRRSRAVSDFIISDYHSASTPPQNHYPAHPQSFSTSLKFNPAANSIGGHHVEGGPIRSNESSDGRGFENKRVMSGLSLAMMNENDNSVNNFIHNAPEHRRVHSANEYGRRCLGEVGHGDNVNDGPYVLPFGSPASRRAAFHTPPPPLLSETPGGGDSGTHFFHRHGGYGYGYNNGSNFQLGNEQKSWDDRILPPPALQSQPETTDTGRSDGPRSFLSHDASRLTSTIPPANRIMNPHHERSGSCTPPTVALWSRSPQHQSPSLSGPQAQYKNSRPTPSISSSMSVQQTILPPITSLDMLQKSPFNIAARKKDTASTLVNEAKHGESDEGGPRNDDEMIMFLSSIPRMVPSANGERSDGNVAVSTLGDDSSGIPIMPNSNDSVAMDARGRVNCSTEPHAGGGCTNIGNSIDDNNACHKSFLPQFESEHLPFAGDDDDTLLAVAPTSSSSPAKSSVGATTNRSLWGSTKADVLDGTIGGGMAEIATSLAVSSLHHRCATDGKIRLQMFEGRKSTIVEATSTNADAGVDPSLDFDAIQDRLSDFRSFGASLMISSTYHEESK